MVSVTSNIRYGSTEHIVHPSTNDRAPFTVVVRLEKLDNKKHSEGSSILPSASVFMRWIQPTAYST